MSLMSAPGQTVMLAAPVFRLISVITAWQAHLALKLLTGLLQQAYRFSPPVQPNVRPRSTFPSRRSTSP